MDFLMLLKSAVSPTTPHYTISLKHLPEEEVVQPWILIQTYSEEQKQELKQWFDSFDKRARDIDVESDTRRVLNYMINLSESDRLRFSIKSGKLVAKYKDDLVLSDLEAAGQLTLRDEQD